MGRRVGKLVKVVEKKKTRAEKEDKSKSKREDKKEVKGQIKDRGEKEGPNSVPGLWSKMIY